MLYLILAVLLLVLALFFYFTYEKDVLSVSFISCIVYALSSLAAFISYIIKDSWNNVNLHFSTMLLILIALLGVGLGEYIVRKVFRSRQQKKLEFINVSYWKVIVCTLFILLTTILVYIDMKNLTQVRGLANIIHEYKINSAMYTNTNVMKINFIYIQMYRISIAIGIIFAYVFVNNLCVNYKSRKNIRYLFPILFAIFLSIFLGGRSSIMRFVIAIFVFAIILVGKKTKIRLHKFIKIGLLSMIVILPMFYLMLGMIGQTTNSNFIDYITFYLGCSIPSFDILMPGLLNNFNGHFGEHTFIGIQHVLYRFGIIDYYNLYQKNWINFGNGLYSNVYTGIKNYIQDFGIYGMMFFQILFGGIYSYLYHKAKNANYRFLIFYGLISINLFDQFRSEKVFSSLFIVDTLVYIITIVVVSWFLFDYKTKGMIKNGN